jgi:hypothetical protein
MSARARDHRVLSVLFVRTVVVERMICPLVSASPFGDEPDEAEQFARPLAGKLGSPGMAAYASGPPLKPGGAGMLISAAK